MTALTTVTDLSVLVRDRTPDPRDYWDHRLAAWVRHVDVPSTAPLQRAGDADDVAASGRPVR